MSENIWFAEAWKW